MNYDKILRQNLSQINCDRCRFADECTVFDEDGNETCNECKWERAEYAAYERAVDEEIDRRLGK